MGQLAQWWSSLRELRQSIIIGLVKCALQDLQEEDIENREQIAITILSSDHQSIDCSERNRVITELITRWEDIVESFREVLEKQGIVSHRDVLHHIETEVEKNIELKAVVLGLVLKESNDLIYLVELAIKIISNTIVDHEGDVARLEEEGRQLEKELLSCRGADESADLEMGEVVEWEIDLTGCPNLQCQYNNPPETDRCKKCGVSLMGECPECYNEIPINSSYCRVCGTNKLEDWAMLHRFLISLKLALEAERYTQGTTLLANIPPKFLQHPEVFILKQQLQNKIPSRSEDIKAKLTQKIENLCERWIAKIHEILSEKRPNFVIASRALDMMPTFLKNDESAKLRKEIEQKRQELVEKGRNRKKVLLLQQIDLLQEKAKYREALSELEKFLPSLQDEALIKKKEELEQVVAEVEKLRARLQGPSWAIPCEFQKKTALQKKMPVARELELGKQAIMRLILIPAGSFDMGSDSGYESEMPVHRIEITQPFYLAITPVTQQQWMTIQNDNPSCFHGEVLPVEQVSWQDCCTFLMILGRKFGEMFRLPTEAEWEYACRADSSASYCFGKDVALLQEYAWFNINSDKQTHPVATKKNNNWGLFDTHGNVWEWCQDCYDERYYHKSPSNNPMGPFADKNSPRVCRGGSWSNIPSDVRCATRQAYPPNFRSSNIGFRPLLVPKK